VRNTSTLRCTLTLIVLTFTSLSGIRSGASQRQRDPLESSNDVAMLESIASADGSADVESMYMGHSGKDHRTAAYARLGAIGTEQSLEAARRVERKLKATPLLPANVAVGVLIHPMWHFGDIAVKPFVTVRISDGTTYGIMSENLLGDDYDLFLISSKSPTDRSAWTRPILIPNRIYRGFHDAKLTEGKPGQLVFAFVQGTSRPRDLMEGQLAPPEKAPVLGKQTWILSPQEIMQDSDGDGWTDIEEQRLGLNPRNRDTDGDGIPDGQDICPNYAPTAGQENEEEVQILQKAVLAQYGLSRSRTLLLVRPGSKRFQIEGYRGPVLYLNDVKEWTAKHPEGGIFVSWQITARSNSDAAVSFTDYEGPMAGGEVELRLHKYGGEWFVTGRTLGWVS
jgi:hypothetical protein